MKPFSYCLIVLDGNDKVCEHVVYSGEDAGVHCLKTLLHFGEKYKKLMDRIAPLRMDQKDILHYEQSENCYLCLKPLLVNGKLDKCIDHSHSMFTKGSNYLGPSHAKCNLARRVQKLLYVFSHNYSGFESHIFMKALVDLGVTNFQSVPFYASWDDEVSHGGEVLEQELEEGEVDMTIRVSMIPINEEKLKTMKINSLVFLDSLSFLSQPLEDLVNDLVESNSDFSIVKQWVKDDETLKMMHRKGVFPYDYATTFEKVKSTTSFPDIEHFYSKLTKSNITEEEHQYGLKIWTHFKCKSLLDYCEVYCVSDVYYLAQALSNFRSVIWTRFKLDMVRYLSLPMLSKQAMLKYTGVKIGLIHNQEICHLLRKNIRGGLAAVSFRHFDKEELSKFYGRDVTAFFLDINNLVSQAKFS